MKTGSIIGIDFGTTNTSVVKVSNDKSGCKTLILGEENNKPFSSILSINPEYKIEFGNIVKQRRSFLAQNNTVISSFKSLLGTDKTIKVNKREFNAQELVTMYLKKLKEYIKLNHNVEIDEAGFSFPVDFPPKARHELKNAAEAAGIKVRCMIPEPTAAFLAVRDDAKGLSRIMAADWGGGTLDISILEINGGKISEKAVYSEKTGGDDIDRELAKRIHAMLSLTVKDKNKRVQFCDMPPKHRDDLHSMCESAKIQMSYRCTDFIVTLRNYGEYGTKSFTLEYSEFEEIIKPIIYSKILKAIDTAMDKAGLSKSNIDAVIIAGGSSNLRPYADAMENIFGLEKLIRPKNYQFISAEGAALAAYIGGGFKLNDDIGILMSDNTVFPILNKGVDGVNSSSDTLTFSLVEDSPDAHFIITNGDGRLVYDKISVPTKGFLNEKLDVRADINIDQTANIKICSSTAPDDRKEYISKITGLTYYYDMTDIDKEV